MTRARNGLGTKHRVERWGPQGLGCLVSEHKVEVVGRARRQL